MRTWEKPIAVVDQFVANSFVSTCGDENTVYNFECNAGERRRHYDVFTDNGTNLTKGVSRYYHPCKETHQANTSDDFITGYMVSNDGNDRLSYWTPFGRKEYPTTKVIIWTNNGTNVHCTTNLDMKTWTTAKS